MMFRSRLLLLVLVLTSANVVAQCGPLGCPSPRTPVSAAQQQVPPPVQQSLASVVRIVHRDATGESIGSGCLIDVTKEAGHVLTCAHLFEAPGQTVVYLGVESVPAKVVAIDKSHDLALLKTPPPARRPAITADWQQVRTMTACGFGSTGALRCVRGAVTGFSKATGASSPSVRIRGMVRSGDSGGPVFDEQGRVVAVVWGAARGETYAMGGGPLHKLLARLTTRPSQPAPIARQPTETEPTDPWREDVERRLNDLARRPDGSPDRESKEQQNHWGERIGRLEGLAEQSSSPSLLKTIARFFAPEALFTATTVAGPVGAALVVGWWWMRRRKTTSSQTRAQPIAVDSPPPPQQVVPETHYVSYERDEFAKAHQWACEQLARKFPGSVELLASLDSLIKQQLNGADK